MLERLKASGSKGSPSQSSRGDLELQLHLGGIKLGASLGHGKSEVARRL